METKTQKAQGVCPRSHSQSMKVSGLKLQFDRLAPWSGNSISNYGEWRVPELATGGQMKRTFPFALKKGHKLQKSLRDEERPWLGVTAPNLRRRIGYHSLCQVKKKFNYLQLMEYL